jgi:hypothetical protein
LTIKTPIFSWVTHTESSPSMRRQEAAAECELPDYGDVNFWTEAILPTALGASPFLRKAATCPQQ